MKPTAEDEDKCNETESGQNINHRLYGNTWRCHVTATFRKTLQKAFSSRKPNEDPRCVTRFILRERDAVSNHCCEVRGACFSTVFLPQFCKTNECYRPFLTRQSAEASKLRSALKSHSTGKLLEMFGKQVWTQHIDQSFNILSTCSKSICFPWASHNTLSNLVKRTTFAL